MHVFYSIYKYSNVYAWMYIDEVVLCLDWIHLYIQLGRWLDVTIPPEVEIVNVMEDHEIAIWSHTQTLMYDPCPVIPHCIIYQSKWIIDNYMFNKLINLNDIFNIILLACIQINTLPIHHTIVVRTEFHIKSIEIILL